MVRILSFAFTICVMFAGRCASGVGFVIGQQLHLASICMADHHNAMAHELMHVLGFWHEHSRTDRDKYIEVSSLDMHPNVHFIADNFGVAVVACLSEIFTSLSQQLMLYFSKCHDNI